MSDSSPQVDYRGNCHCGAFKFTFKSPELKQGFACNCSFCAENGYLWAFPTDLNIVKGDEKTTLQTYQFGKRTMEHKFCPHCGTSVMARTADGKVGINIRAVADVDLYSLMVSTSDGAKTEPLYQAPEPVAVESLPDGVTAYHGSCQCGAVGYTLLSPANITSATDCNCSICSRDGALWIYPEIATVTFKGLDSLSEYTFARRTTYHGFCKICGVAIRERYDSDRTDVALNIRTLNEFDLAAVELVKLDNKPLLPLYDV
ncbi:Mss4-like protein [Mycena vitilis]|nr:Mss4-like protein [Mycena vitilis]